MHMRALSRVFRRCVWGLHHLYFKLYGKGLGRIASRIVAGLVPHLSTELVLAGQHAGERSYHNRKSEVAALYAECIVGSEGEGHLFAIRIGDLPHRNVRGWINL